MPPSQLKRLKASLKAAGLVGPQKSKKEKKQASKSGKSDPRADKHLKLQSIREEFNPFELKTTRVKHDVSGRAKIKGAQGRPGVSKQIGEEHRRKTLLVEIQKRNKAGGIVDRRFGENDPTMPPEERMLERFTREKQSRLRNGDIFNLEDDDMGLTHFGQSLGELDDFDERDMLPDGGDDTAEVPKWRKRGLEGEDGEDEGSDAEGEPARKKTRAEIMKEVIQKSKMHKYARQKAKEEDEDVREQLDAQMGDIWALLTNNKPLPPPLLPTSGIGDAAKQGDKTEVERNQEYDAAVREMIFDKRSKPAERTKTEEEKAQEEAERLKKLEEERQMRMRGETGSDDENDREGLKQVDGDDDNFGLGSGIPVMLSTKGGQPNPDELVDGDYEVDESFEDDGSGAEYSDDYNTDVSEPEAGEGDEDDLDAEFLADVLPDKEGKAKKLVPSSSIADDVSKDDKLAYTYPCPETHKEFLLILKDVPIESLPTVIQRIRILYNPKLAEGNKAKLGNFAVVLLEHIIHVAKTVFPLPFSVLEAAIRHLHALAKAHPLKVSEAFRERLSALHQKTSNEMNAGDLIMLTAINTIFPTSDHFHPVVTPASLLMGKYLGQSPPDSLRSMCIGTYIITLLVQGQRLSKRVIPEAVNYILLSLCLLSPVPLQKLPGSFPYHEPPASLHIKAGTEWEPRKLSFSDMFDGITADTDKALLSTLIDLLIKLAELWVGKSAFPEVFTPAQTILQHILNTTNQITSKHTKKTNSKSLTPLLPSPLISKLTSATTTLESHLTHAHFTRRPLELHHHRPLPIPSNIPKFEESYSLDKRSYDPDRERMQITKLKAEHKRERKGALRELRKDASFVAREKLKEEKAASKEYHAKMARLTAMIQHEEGQGKNDYEREKRLRKKR
ncbi:nucleolar protein 14 [Kalaharituber pfeilii]|nr:nucleolar protein 14 [Kalaharituber pfeilii]